MSQHTPVIGIDFGGTNSCVAVYIEDNVEIMINSQNNRTTPSVVAFADTTKLFGETAKSYADINAQNTVYDIKRLIGRPFEDSFVQTALKHFPFMVVNANNKPNVEIEIENEKYRFSLEKIASMFFRQMKQSAETYADAKVTEAVITIPVNFNRAQREAITDAATRAGLDVLQILDEPTAAVIAYGLDKVCVEGPRNVLVYDLGGGTFTVSVLTVDDGFVEVKATSVDAFLGGMDFDARIMIYFANEFKQKYAKNLFNDEQALRRLRVASEQAKVNLSSSTETAIEIVSLFDGIDFELSITRDTFESICMDLFKSTLEIVQQTLTDVNMDVSHVEDIILVGGSTQIPMIQKLLQEFFNGKQLNICISPDEVVAYGAAVHSKVFIDNKKGQDEEYKNLVDLEFGNCVLNMEHFECPICFGQIDIGEGIVLRECLHTFCRECLSGTIDHNEAVQVACPFQDELYKCDCTLQDREIKELASPETYARYLQKSVSLAEQSVDNSFHCKTIDCIGWCLYENDVHEFFCQVCSHLNCINCRTIHEGKNCREYQDELKMKPVRDEHDRKTKQHLEELLKNGLAMHCPQCQVVIIKKDGCDGLKCTVCNTQICWATKGFRWGPKGHGDITGGCRCQVEGKRCHPNCQNCH